MSLLDAAVVWARAGKPVFPVGADKRPLTRHGLLDATTDVDRIVRFWRAHPHVNVAVRCGQPSRLVVLDVDGEAGADALRDLEHEHGPLPATSSVKTPRGGAHYYFRWPGVPIKTTAGVIAPGIDVRGDGGYTLLPPSRTAHGAYEFDRIGPLESMSPWLIGLTRNDQNGHREATPPDEWISMLRDGIPDGRRNVDLARLTGYLLRRFVAVDLTTEFVHLVNEHRCRPPLSRREVERIVESMAGREWRRRERRSQ